MMSLRTDEWERKHDGSTLFVCVWVRVCICVCVIQYLHHSLKSIISPTKAEFIDKQVGVMTLTLNFLAVG